jgi:hypothetical protein
LWLLLLLSLLLLLLLSLLLLVLFSPEPCEISCCGSDLREGCVHCVALPPKERRRSSRIAATTTSAAPAVAMTTKSTIGVATVQRNSINFVSLHHHWQQACLLGIVLREPRAAPEKALRRFKEVQHLPTTTTTAATAATTTTTTTTTTTMATSGSGHARRRSLSRLFHLLLLLFFSAPQHPLKPNRGGAHGIGS